MKTIDLSKWVRRQHFVPNLRNCSLDYPHYCLTSNADITRSIHVAKKTANAVWSFYKSLHLSSSLTL